MPRTGCQPTAAGHGLAPRSLYIKIKQETTLIMHVNKKTIQASLFRNKHIGIGIIDNKIEAVNVNLTCIVIIDPSLRFYIRHALVACDSN